MKEEEEENDEEGEQEQERKEEDEEEEEKQEKFFKLKFFSNFYKWTYLMRGFCSVAIYSKVVTSLSYEL